MYDKHSDYALNKRHPDAIVYTDADGNEIKLIRADFASDEEFFIWKEWSDTEYRETEKAGRGYYDHTVPLNEDMDTYGDSILEELFALTEKQEYNAKCAAQIAQIRAILTDVQFRRLWLYCVKGMTEQQIADQENVGQRRVSTSITDAKKKISKIFGLGEKEGAKNG